MTMPTTRPKLAHLCLLLALASAGAAQAASLSLTTGSAGGSLFATAGVNGQADAISGSLVDTSGAGFVLAAGGGESSLALAPAGSLDHLWAASTALDTSPAQTSFHASATSVRLADASGQFDGGVESLSLVLDAELLIQSTGEAAGTPVRLDVQGTAESLFSSSGPALDVLPSFDLVLRDAQGAVLGSWQGLAPGASTGFSFSVFSQVGATLHFSLSHASSLLADAAAIGAAGTGISLDSTALLNGSLSVSAVPEPETYALFVAGLAALGLMQARRRAG
ncbi:MAG: PEP-CTERM sorting domain-containing protein [Pseudomonadota bacterium]